MPLVVLAVIAGCFVREAVVGVRNWSADGERMRTRSGNYQAAWLHRVSIPLAAVLVPVTLVSLINCLS